MIFNIRLLLPLTWMGGIFLLSSIPDTNQPASLAEQALQWVSPDIQNLLHIPLYFGLAMAWIWALEKNPGLAARLLPAILISGMWAMLDEYHQLFVPGRFGSWTDVTLDLAGVLGAALASIAARHPRNQPKFRDAKSP